MGLELIVVLQRQHVGLELKYWCSRDNLNVGLKLTRWNSRDKCGLMLYDLYSTCVCVCCVVLHGRFAITPTCTFMFFIFCIQCLVMCFVCPTNIEFIIPQSITNNNTDGRSKGGGTKLELCRVHVHHCKWRDLSSSPVIALSIYIYIYIYI